MVGAGRKKILARLPYLGLDIEGVEKDIVRVEYSPNRPDFGTDFGIARAMRGLLGRDTGLPRFQTKPSGIRVAVDRRLSDVRPYISCAEVAGLHLDDEGIRQVISLQEDLHNGLGRKRRLVAIGIHDMDAIEPPLSYRAVSPALKFVPLNGQSEVSLSTLLSETPEGRMYGDSLRDKRLLPLITDSRGTVLSFPPIINGDATKVTSKTRHMFIDVTSTDRKAGDDVMAVISTTLSAAGGALGTVTIGYPRRPAVTPDLSPIEVPLDYGLVNSSLGMKLTKRQIIGSLAKSRIGVKGATALAPRYRVDLLHPVDLAEEVALGYGVDRIVPVYPPSSRPGRLDDFERFLDSTSTVMAESGMIEVMTLELTDEKSLFSKFGRQPTGKVTVMNPKSIDHSVLRDSLMPSLMASLSRNVKADYPQRIFEIGRVYSRAGEGVSESWRLGCVVAHSQSSFSEAKMHAESVCRILSGKEAGAAETEHWAFSQGRCASVTLGGRELGQVGEVKPEAIEAFGLGVPVSGFELDLTSLFELLK